MVNVDWNERARAGVGLQSVIDPGDRSGRKNALIDRVQWDHHIEPWARSRRNVLDFGCGIGRFAQRLSSLGISYCGTDTSEAMIEAARRLHDAASARFLHAPGLPLPLESGFFDGCLTVGVLQCLKTADGQALQAAIAELARVLSPGGELLMIEQASASGGFSGSVTESASEDDYLRALAGGFDVVSRQRVRKGTPSRLSSLYIQRGAVVPLRDRVEGLLARRESALARDCDPATLAREVYYDIAIRAVRRAGA